MGIAVIRDGELIAWMVKTFDGAFSKLKLVRIIKSLEHILAEHNARTIACKVTEKHKTSAYIRQIVSGIKKVAKRSNIPVAEYALHNLKSYCQQTTNPIRKNVVGFVVEKHYVLAREIASSSRFEYHYKVFEAVALADHHYSKTTTQ